MDEEEVDLREYINVLIKRKWIVILFFLIAIITAIIVSYFILPPIYKSSVSFQVLSDSIKKSEYEKDETSSISISDILFILTSDSVLKKAKEKIN